MRSLAFCLRPFILTKDFHRQFCTDSFGDVITEMSQMLQSHQILGKLSDGTRSVPPPLSLRPCSTSFLLAFQMPPSPSLTLLPDHVTKSYRFHLLSPSWLYLFLLNRLYLELLTGHQYDFLYSRCTCLKFF